jgi:hypothetical protein
VSKNEEGVGTERISESDCRSQPDKISIAPIDPSDVVEWLVTQLGYSKGTATGYVSVLRTMSEKLRTSSGLNIGCVFDCHTLEELNAYRDVYLTHPNCNINDIPWTVYAAMNRYQRYLKHLLDTSDGTTVAERKTVGSAEDGFSQDMPTDEASRTKEKFCGTSHSVPDDGLMHENPVLQSDSAIIGMLPGVLSVRFPNGYRLSSPIEMNRLRSYVDEAVGEKLLLTDEEIIKHVVACGTVFEGKVYAVSAQSKKQIRQMAKDYFAEGAQIIEYSEFYDKNERFMFDASIVSVEMMIPILQDLFPEMSFTRTYFGRIEDFSFWALESEVLRVWGDDVLLTQDEIAKRLRYVSFKRVKEVLAYDDGDFVRNGPGTYTHLGKIDVTDCEVNVIRAAAARACYSKGYASMVDLPYEGPQGGGGEFMGATIGCPRLRSTKASTASALKMSFAR